MLDYIDEIERWMEQVKNEDTAVEEYTFLDRVDHQKPGNGGIANVGAYLAIYEKEEGNLEVDEELVDALDERHGSSRSKKFQNIVYDAVTEKRERNTLYDKNVDGHGFIQKMIKEFRENAEISSPNNNKYKDKGDNNLISFDKHGDNMNEYNRRFDELNESVEEDEVETLEEYMEKARDILVEAEEEYGEPKEAHFYKLTEGIGTLLGFEGREVLDAANALEEDSVSTDSLSESGLHANKRLRQDYEEFVEEVSNKLGRWGETYKRHMQEVSNNMMVTGERLENANSSLKEVSNNLESANEKLRSISGSPPDKTPFEDGVGELEELRRESSMEFDESYLPDEEE